MKNHQKSYVEWRKIMINKDFTRLIEEAKKLAIKRKLSEYASCGHVGCALQTKNGNIYTGICIDSNCALGNCAEYVVIFMKTGFLIH